jgi:hypothetical protein
MLEVVGEKRIGEAMENEVAVGRVAGNAVVGRWGTRVAVVAMRCHIATSIGDCNLHRTGIIIASSAFSFCQNERGRQGRTTVRVGMDSLGRRDGIAIAAGENYKRLVVYILTER